MCRDGQQTIDPVELRRSLLKISGGGTRRDMNCATPASVLLSFIVAPSTRAQRERRDSSAARGKRKIFQGVSLRPSPVGVDYFVVTCAATALPGVRKAGPFFAFRVKRAGNQPY